MGHIVQLFQSIYFQNCVIFISHSFLQIKNPHSINFSSTNIYTSFDVTRQKMETAIVSRFKTVASTIDVNHKGDANCGCDFIFRFLSRIHTYLHLHTNFIPFFIV